MAKEMMCDMCQKPAKIVAKIYLGPRGQGADFSAYTAHADVGECCLSRINNMIKWQRRRKINRTPKAA